MWIEPITMPSRINRTVWIDSLIVSMCVSLFLLCVFSKCWTHVNISIYYCTSTCHNETTKPFWLLTIYISTFLTHLTNPLKVHNKVFSSRYTCLLDCILICVYALFAASPLGCLRVNCRWTRQKISTVNWNAM